MPPSVRSQGHPSAPSPSPPTLFISQAHIQFCQHPSPAPAAARPQPSDS
eukprot:CAMPEP_0172180258 /NCGR_PEP_ID=MMETSP1050-20130122/17110_1 /TAXON_ID=233186 /ORGANISM="Cryptomonas curvata, Strain CCAP979/52" /LENGTH=48 /DNA_ID= /DNA_START= /DNA_END= /DNA_ORIENTATION=